MEQDELDGHLDLETLYCGNADNRRAPSPSRLWWRAVRARQALTGGT